MKLTVIFSLLFLSIFIISCEKTIFGLPPENEVLEGQIEGLSHEENLQFLRGDIDFAKVFTSKTGLGPLFVSNSCISCHAGDGKGHPFTTLVRFGQSDQTGNTFLDLGGPQLQNRALPGHTPETVPIGASFTKLLPPQNTGLGFLDAVTDEDIMLMADPLDRDGDGISGVPNWRPINSYLDLRLNSIEQEDKYIHRFGKKASAYNLLHQTVNAYNQDMGIASHYEPFDTFTGLLSDPEISNNSINDVVFYLKTLKAPIQRDQTDSRVKSGSKIFENIQCAACHKPTLKTGFSLIKGLAFKEFHPYTDLLLHDMGPGLDDGYTEGNAKTSEWRTPPLWGLGLSPNSQGGSYFLMHDGRANSIEEAILLHGGEAISSKNQFKNLLDSEKDDLIKFLESL